MPTQPETPKEPTATQPKIEAEVYNAVISQLKPLDVRLISLAFDVHPQQLFSQLQATASAYMPELVEVTELQDGSHLFGVNQRMTFEVSAPDQLTVAQGRVTFSVRLRVGFRPPDEFWPIFLQRNVKLYTHPPLRDLIASLCGRANLVVNLLDSVSVIQGLVSGKPEVGKGNRPRKKNPALESRTLT